MVSFVNIICVLHHPWMGVDLWEDVLSTWLLKGVFKKITEGSLPYWNLLLCYFSLEIDPSALRSNEQTLKNEVEARVDNFVQITVFWSPKTRVEAFVYSNAGKFYYSNSIKISLCTMSRILIRIKRLILPPMTYENRLIIKAYSLRVLSSISDSSFWLRRSLRIASLFLCATISSCSWYSCCARAFRSINFSSVASKTPKIGALESGSSAGMGRGLQRTYKHASHYITVQNDCKVLGPGDLTNSAWLCLPSSTIVEVWIETSVACARRSYTVKPR